MYLGSLGFLRVCVCELWVCKDWRFSENVSLIILASVLFICVKHKPYWGIGPVRKTEMRTLKRVQCWCGSCSGWTASQCTSRHRKRKKKGGRGRERERKNRQEPVLSRGRALIQKQGAQGNNKKKRDGVRGEKKTKKTSKQQNTTGSPERTLGECQHSA